MNLNDFINLTIWGFFLSFFTKFTYILKYKVYNFITGYIIISNLLNVNNCIYNTLQHTLLIEYFELLILIFGLIILLHIKYNYLNNQLTISAIFFLLFSIMGFLIVLKATNFLTLFLAIELGGLSTYLLLGCCRNNNLCIESLLKYLIFNSFASGLLIYSISYLYGLLGTINYNEITFLIILGFLLNKNSLLLYINISIFLISFLIKLGAVPFHFHILDIYEGTSSAITLFLLTIPKLTYIYMLITITIYIFNIYIINYIMPLYLYIGLSTCIIACILTLKQIKLKRFLIYSSINYTGLIIITMTSFTSNENIAPLLPFLLLYFISSIGVWLLILDNSLLYKTSLNGFFAKNKINAILLLILLLSISGLPFLGGFLIKFFIYKNLIHIEYIIPVIILIFTQLISTYYYLNLIFILFFNNKILCSKKNSFLLKNKFLISNNDYTLYITFFSCLFLINFFFFEIILRKCSLLSELTMWILFN